MKKLLPLIILLLGVVVVAVVFLILKGGIGRKVIENIETEESLPEIELEKRPAVSLTPSVDGHYLKLEIKKILIEAASLDYELTYEVDDGRIQGVPGTVKLTSKEDITKDLLLGSESSGKFRYDEGVETGQLSLRFRDKAGKLVAKFETDFRLQSNTSEVIFFGNSIYKFDKIDLKAFYVSMDTIGYPGETPLTPEAAYGVFPSTGTSSGTIEISNIYLWRNNNWIKIDNGNSPSSGFFLILS